MLTIGGDQCVGGTALLLPQAEIVHLYQMHKAAKHGCLQASHLTIQLRAYQSDQRPEIWQQSSSSRAVPHARLRVAVRQACASSPEQCCGMLHTVA